MKKLNFRPFPPSPIRFCYVHVPFCLHKCYYCDFFSLGISAADIPETAYLKALVQELHRWQQSLASAYLTELQTLFWGGGTPSLLTPNFFESFLPQLAKGVGFADDIEISIEMNPKTADPSKLSAFRQVGINRV